MNETIQQNAPYPGDDIKFQMQLQSWCETNNVAHCETEEFERLLKSKALRPIPKDQVKKVPRLAKEMHSKISMTEAFTSHWAARFLLGEKGKDNVLRRKYNLDALQYLTRGRYGQALGDINRIWMQD